jgi:hypothetical protein
MRGRFKLNAGNNTKIPVKVVTLRRLVTLGMALTLVVMTLATKNKQVREVLRVISEGGFGSVPVVCPVFLLSELYEQRFGRTRWHGTTPRSNSSEGSAISLEADESDFTTRDLIGLHQYPRTNNGAKLAEKGFQLGCRPSCW